MLLTLPPGLEEILRKLNASGHRPVVVGGAVRDALLGIPPKDFDIEIHNASYDTLSKLLGPYGRIDQIGRSFGVIKLSLPTRQFDFTIPRRENKTGPQHRDFQTSFDPSITPQEAASRRDFTINALAYDPLTDEILDFFNGRADLENRILRATSAAFAEDPLRVLRGMQFACRFDLTLDPATAETCRGIAAEYSTLARERVSEEFMKWAIKSPHPGRILEYLTDSGWLIHFPEIATLAGVPQDPGWHPEGDVGTHTMLVVNAAASIAQRENLNGDARAVLLFSALAHDFAKPATTKLREREGKMRWTSWDHEAQGGPLARTFLERIGIKSAIIDQVVPLVENHLAHSNIGREATPRAVRRLAMRLAPASITQLINLIEADHSGRPPLPPGLPAGAVRIQAMAQSQSVAQGPQPPLIQGRDVLPYFDNVPGKPIGDVVKAAYEAQLDGAFSAPDEASSWLAAYLKK
jgi:tRNA nucleotidyltransferase (CCA-adding enzyme)